MKSVSFFADSHLHFFDPKWQGQSVHELMKQFSIGQNNLFAGASYSTQDWAQQFNFSKDYSNYAPVIGLHPMMVSQLSDIEIEEALNLLIEQAPLAHAIGEIGLDLRPAFERSYDWQAEVFREQLELAQKMKKPIVLHIVRALSEATFLLDLIGVPEKGGIVHAFNGSYSESKEYLERGLSLSFGSAITYKKNQRLVEVVQKVPLEQLFLESDSPDQPPEGWGSAINNPTSILQTAQLIAECRGVSVEFILEKSYENVRRMFFYDKK